MWTINVTMYSCKILNRILARLKSMTDGGGFQLKQLCRDIEQRSLPANRLSSLHALSSCNKKMSKYTIVMVRHGESEWNQLNLFCGWYDANLSDKGKSFCTRINRENKPQGRKVKQF